MFVEGQWLRDLEPLASTVVLREWIRYQNGNKES